MKYKDLKDLEEKELEKRLAEAKFELIKLQGQSATGTSPKNPSQISQFKRTIAKIKTIQNSRKKDKR